MKKYIELTYQHRRYTCITSCPYRMTPTVCVDSYMCKKCSHYQGAGEKEKIVLNKKGQVYGNIGTIKCSYLNDQEKVVENILSSAIDDQN